LYVWYNSVVDMLAPSWKLLPSNNFLHESSMSTLFQPARDPVMG